MNVYPLKCRIRAEAGVTRVDIFDDIGPGGWFSEGLTAADFANQLSSIRGPLHVHVNSGGGDVFDGVAIKNTIAAHKGPVTTIVDGIAASIASVIIQAGQERVVQPGAMVMIHDAFGGCVGNASEMAKQAETLDKVSGDLADVYAGRSGKDAAYWRDQMKAETWYTAEEAVSAGLADRVGDGVAQLPESMDLAALGNIPGRIAARLREMPTAHAPQPQDAARHDPMKGTHSHPHPAYGSQGADAMHSHEHQHDGDANHSHSHAAADDGEGAQDSASGQDCPTCKGTGKIMEGNRDCPDCDGTGKKAAAAAALTADDVLALIRHELQAASGKPGTHGDHERFDPDGDGDCDACPEGDTDHDYWTAAGEQLKDVPGKPMEDHTPTAAEIRAIVREELAGLATFLGAAVDNSEWDASKAWHNGTEADDPEAFYRGICAGEKTSGDPKTQAHWALPYKYTPSSAPNAAGVRNALARLDSTQDLKDAEGARKKLQGLMKQINPDYEPEDSAGDGPGDTSEDDLSGIDLEQIRTGFSALKGAMA